MERKQKRKNQSNQSIHHGPYGTVLTSTDRRTLKNTLSHSVPVVPHNLLQWTPAQSSAEFQAQKVNLVLPSLVIHIINLSHNIMMMIMQPCVMRINH